MIKRPAWLQITRAVRPASWGYGKTIVGWSLNSANLLVPGGCATAAATCFTAAVFFAAVGTRRASMRRTIHAPQARSHALVTLHRWYRVSAVLFQELTRIDKQQTHLLYVPSTVVSTTDTSPVCTLHSGIKYAGFGLGKHIG